MESLRAFIGEPFGANLEFRKLCYYSITVLPCLFVFRRTRWWLLLLPRALWILSREFWTNLFLCFSYQPGCDENLIMLLESPRVNREPMTRKEIWSEVMNWKTKKQRNRMKYKEMHGEREINISRGLVVLDGHQISDQWERPWTPRKRKTTGIVESVATPVKNYSGSDKGHCKGTIRHARYSSNGSSGSVSSFRHASSSSIGNAGGEQNGQPEGCQTGQNGIIGKKNKNKDKNRR